MNSLRNFSEGTTFFTEVYHDTDAASLSGSHALFNGENEIWLARWNSMCGSQLIHSDHELILTADVTSKYVGPVTLIVDAESKLLGYIAEIRRISN